MDPLQLKSTNALERIAWALEAIARNRDPKFRTQAEAQGAQQQAAMERRQAAKTKEG